MGRIFVQEYNNSSKSNQWDELLQVSNLKGKKKKNTNPIFPKKTISCIKKMVGLNPLFCILNVSDFGCNENVLENPRTFKHI